jgi:hypothetical protein
MHMSSSSFIIVFILSACILYFLSIIYLSKKKNALFGLILPIIFGCISIYYLLKLIIIYNPHPTMKEPIYMTFFGALSVIGFIEFFVAKYHLKNKNNNRMWIIHSLRRNIW